MNPFEAVAILGTMSIIGITIVGTVRAVSGAWARRAERFTGMPQEELLDAIERLHREIGALRDEFGYRLDDLDERIDFTERLLQDGRESKPLSRRSRVIGLTPI